MSLLNIIEGKLPLSVHDYMQLCLQHPEYGYYRKAVAVGKQGDFITAPEISQIFGDLIGMWLRDVWQQLGEPEFHLVECGPGRGTLSADVLRMLPPCKLHLVESSETLREAQKEALWKHNPTWHDDLSTLPNDRPLLIIANEFFDAFPVRQWVGDEERKVVEGLAFSPQGEVTREESPMASQIMAQICERLKAQGGVFLTVDYGYLEGAGDTLQAVKKHTFHNPLETPGEADLTSHVDFSALKKVVEKVECMLMPIVTQEKFLRSLGGEIWLQKLLLKTTETQAQKDLQEGWLRLTSPATMGELFKVMAVLPNYEIQPGGFA
ncbi:MAG: SAM-dependent methyltransferase [Rickettsiales bacterium]|nr:SAM-dependent methyltransferase [Rickettsiales bacterium]